MVTRFPFYVVYMNYEHTTTKKEICSHRFPLTRYIFLLFFTILFIPRTVTSFELIIILCLLFSVFFLIRLGAERISGSTWCNILLCSDLFLVFKCRLQKCFLPVQSLEIRSSLSQIRPSRDLPSQLHRMPLLSPGSW